jgi:ABC-type glycerol-3-phosphate transport system permease component
MKLKSIAFVIAGLIIIYLIPLLNGFNAADDVFPEVLAKEDYFDALLRSLFFALGSVLFCVVGSFTLAYVMRNISSRVLLLVASLMMLPFLMGNVSLSFLFKILLFDSDVINSIYQSTSLLFVIMFLLQFWQNGFLFTYVFLLNNKGIDEDLINYGEVNRFTSFEKIKNIYLPNQRNLIILLSIFSFVTSFYESAKFQIILRSSQGTNSELISQKLYNGFKSDLMINARYAADSIFAKSLLFYIPLSILMVFLIYIILNISILKLSKSTIQLPNINLSVISKNRIASFLMLSAVGFIITPIIMLFLKQEISFGKLSYLAETISLSAIAALLLIILFAIPIGLSLRIGFLNVFHSFNNKSISVFIILFLLYLLPPLALMLCGFEWSSFFNFKGSLSTRIFWLFGQCINSLPIVATFIIVIHFYVKNKELIYLKSMRLTNTETIKYSFLKRFKLEYLLTLLFAFSLIWNEGTFNKVYSDRIPSYVSEIMRTVSSRNADYSQGMLFFVFSLIISLACIVIWNVITIKQNKAF